MGGIGFDLFFRKILIFLWRLILESESEGGGGMVKYSRV